MYPNFLKLFLIFELDMIDLICIFPKHKNDLFIRY